MAELVVFADAEGLVVDHLTAALTGRPGFVTVTVSTSLPNPRPAESVVAFRTGGARRDIVTDSAQITVEARAASESRAVEILSLVRALLNDMYGRIYSGAAVYGVEELSGPGNLPDPVGNQPRYTQTFLIHIRGSVTA